MKRKLLAAAASLLLLATGCQNTPEPSNGAEANANNGRTGVQTAGDPGAGAQADKPATAGAATGPDSANRSAVQEAGGAENDWIPLSWENATVDGNMPVLKEGLSQAERIVKTTALHAIAGSRKTEVVIYAKQGDTDHLHAALVRDNVAYDLGLAAGYAYDRDDALTVSNIVLFQKEVVKIQGAVGAAASTARYIDLTNGTPKLLLAVDEGYATESDVDHDGLPEIVVSAGTIPHTSIYRWKDGRIERTRLNEALQAEAASITEEGAVLGAFGPDQSDIRLYWLKKDGLNLFASYSSEAFYSDRYVTIPYTPDELLAIREQADQMRIFEPYAPRKGIATDDLVEVRIVEDGVMQLTYPHFGIRQSSADLRPQDMSAFVPGEKLHFPDFTAEWIGLADSEAGGDWYIRRGSTYLSIGTAKSVSKDELLFVIASLAPLEELKLPDGG